MKLFVTSTENSLGTGTLVEVDQKQATGRVRYFDSPLAPLVEQNLPVKSLRKVALHPQQRVYWVDSDTGDWAAGRLNHGEPVPSAAVQNIVKNPEGNYYLVRFPNQVDVAVPEDQVQVRWSRPIERPSEILASQTQESPFWHEGRSKFTASIRRQRAVFGGLTGLASSSIDLYPHQVKTVRKILRDPIQRYLLADEVGLGKTIEAGVVIRQHRLDLGDSASIIVGVPSHLVGQWREELTSKFSLGGDLDVQIHLTSHNELAEEEWQAPTLLVIDEVQRIALSEREEAAIDPTYLAARHLASQAAAVLLLSATPVLRHERGFLSMLHLLDPNSYPLDDLQRFRDRVGQREEVARIITALEPDGDSFFIEEALDDLEAQRNDDPHLDRLCKTLMPLLERPEDDPGRQSAIQEVRVHLQEKYRLHRRLLRTRRADDSVRDDLPIRTVKTRAYSSRLREASFEVLEEWRLHASEAVLDNSDLESAAGATFVEFLCSHLSHPSSLRRALRERLALIRHNSEVEFFSGEADFLEHSVNDISGPDTELVDELEGLLLHREGRKTVVFLDEPEMADWVATELRNRLGEPVHRFEESTESVLRFTDDDAVQTLICDRTAEEGLNLQRARACIVHADLPLAATRIEQRIGRLDRLSAKSNVVSIVLEAESPYDKAWAACLRESIQVFTRSIAPLQYILEEGHTALQRTVLHAGKEAIDDLSRSFAAPQGALSLETELERIAAQETIDAIEELGARDTAFFDDVEEAEYGQNHDIQDAIHSWAVRNLQFRRTDAGETVRFEHRSRGQPTLVGGAEFLQTFAASIDTDASSARRVLTHPGAYRRMFASKNGVPILRVGNAFVDSLADFSERDTRGIAYAFWRIVDAELGTDSGTSFFYRFDYVIEGNTSLAEEALGSSIEHLSMPAVRRRIDDALPPMPGTIWLDADFNHLQDEKILAILVRHYEPSTSRRTKPDLNINKDRWPSLDQLGLYTDWSSHTLKAASEARRMVAVFEDIAGRKAAAIRAIEYQAGRRAAQLQSRISSLSGRAAEGEMSSLSEDRAIVAAMKTAVEGLTVRFDSVGAIFLSQNELDQLA